MSSGISTFAFPTRIIFGVGSVRELGPEILKHGIKKPLLVTDTGVVKVGLVDLIKQAAPGIHFAVFDSVSANPTEKNVLEAIEFYRQEGCDGVVALGGGSPLDAGKVIRLGVTHPLPLDQYDDQLNGSDKIGSNLPPMIAVATTSGTGSEVGRSAVILLESTDRKTVIFSPYLIPNVAIDDPELTAGMPPAITAGTGLDALTHNVEAYLAKGYHPMCDAIALYGTRLAAKSLTTAVHNGSDLQARTDMMMASVMGAVAFQKGLGVVHSLAHPLSSIAGLHHGTTNGVLLPYALEFNRTVVDDRIRDLAVAMELNVSGLSVQDAATAAINRVRELLGEVGVSEHLGALGIRQEMIPALSTKAMEDACHLLNPRPCTLSDMTALYEAAL